MNFRNALLSAQNGDMLILNLRLSQFLERKQLFIFHASGVVVVAVRVVVVAAVW